MAMQDEVMAKMHAEKIFQSHQMTGMGTAAPPMPPGLGMGIPVQQPTETRIAELSQHVTETSYALTEARRAFLEAQARLSMCEQNFAQASDALLEQIQNHRGVPTPAVNRAY